MWDTMREYLTDEAITNAERDNMAVDEFANAMKEKLERARAKGRYGWQSKLHCSDQHLANLFHEHLQKCNDGNFIDLANFLMFLHTRGANPDVLIKTCEVCKFRHSSSICENGLCYIIENAPFEIPFDDYGCNKYEPNDNA